MSGSSGIRMIVSGPTIESWFPAEKGRTCTVTLCRSVVNAVSCSRMMAEVPKADVVVTNPTHFAVALKYLEGRHQAPVVVAKGTDTVAERIKELARENGVPQLEAPPDRFTFILCAASRLSRSR